MLPSLSPRFIANASTLPSDFGPNDEGWYQCWCTLFEHSITFPQGRLHTTPHIAMQARNPFLFGWLSGNGCSGGCLCLSYRASLMMTWSRREVKVESEIFFMGGGVNKRHSAGE